MLDYAIIYLVQYNVTFEHNLMITVLDYCRAPLQHVLRSVGNMNQY